MLLHYHEGGPLAEEHNDQKDNNHELSSSCFNISEACFLIQPWPVLDSLCELHYHECGTLAEEHRDQKD